MFLGLAFQLYFNPRSQGGATNTRAAIQPTEDISIHAPKGERRYQDWVNVGMALFQSTLPRGSDSRKRDRGGRKRISIHAPKGERQGDLGKVLGDYKISIHAPKGERHTSMCFSETADGFQSTLPRGSDTLIHPLRPVVG